jgi:hypothetical protein
LKKAVAGLLGAALTAFTLMVVPAATAHADGVQPYVVATSGGDGSSDGNTNLAQLSISYQCDAGLFVQIAVDVTSPYGAYADTVEYGPEVGGTDVPMCTGDVQSYVLYLESNPGYYIGGSGLSYDATMYEAATTVSGPLGPEIWDSGLQNGLNLAYQYPSYAPPDPVTDTVVSSTANSVTLSWAPPTAVGGLPISGYAVTCRTGALDAAGICAS